MAFFMDPGAMFLGCLGPSEQKFLVTLIETAAKSGYTRFVEPCAGTFAMANLAVQNGFKPEQIETSDVNMMSTVLGYAITGQSLEPLEIHAQGFSDEELLDPATALYAQLYLRTSKNAGNDYFYQILTDLRLRREEHIESINRQIEVIRNLLGGMSYRPLDMWEHLKEVLDDPHALVIANPPTYFSGYEKFYDTQGKMTWKEPPYELFDPETGHQQFYDLCMNAKALVICYQEKRVGEAVGYTIYARSGTRADLNAYITTNREEEATALANGKKIKRPAESKLQPLDCSMLPRDYEIKEDSKVQVIPIKAAEAQYYRELWTHNFVGSSATFNRALLIDGYVAGVFGISKMASDSVFVWYVMKVPHKTYRLGRLCYMLAQNRAFVDTLLDNIEQEKVTKMRTAMLTRYPENKEVRGIMKLVNRVEDKKNGYKLTYEAEERKSAGVMQVDLYCDERKTLPEDIEPYIRKCLVNLIVKPEGNSHYAFAWARTEMFSLERSARDRGVDTMIVGASVRFDILEYSRQETANPDPVQALSRWLKDLEKESLVIGKDHIEKFFEPSGERPAFYVRVQSYKTNRATYALTWVDCNLAIHIIVPEPENRSLWARYIADRLNMAGEVIMLDDSPMLIFEVSVENNADYLTRGQVMVKAQYSIPRIGEVEHPLSKIKISQKEEK